MRFPILQSIIAVFLFFISVSAIADCRPTFPTWAPEFNQVYKQDEFYVYYSTLASSKHRVQMQDFNKNNIPDYVENIARQAQASREIFQRAQFQHPLQSRRYKHQAQAISIFIQHMNGNGVAYEAVNRHPSITATTAMPCSLMMAVSNNLDNFPANYWTTVTHELFHLYQYGYSQFKNSWYLESMANWAERALRIDINQQTKNLKPLPQSIDAIQNEIFKQNYNPLWRRYFYLQQQDAFHIPQDLQQKTYVDGSLIFKDQIWYGTHFVRSFLETLAKSSDKISKEKNWPQYHWQEANQKRSDLNCTVLQAYQEQLKKQKNLAQEAQFLAHVSLNPQSEICK